MFCASAEVQRKILRCRSRAHGGVIEVFDVLRWCIAETHLYTRKCVPLWAAQGVRSQRREIAWSELRGDDGLDIPLDLAKSLLEPEAQSLGDRYGFAKQRPEEVLMNEMSDTSLVKRDREMKAIQARCEEFEVISFDSASLQEEQERELSPESEQERQVERPARMAPCQHVVHQDVLRFIQQGILSRSSPAFHPAFGTLRDTTAARHHNVEEWPDRLLVTADFARTVKSSKGQLLDSYLRPVHWIASCKNSDTIQCVVLSPYEAHELLPSVRRHKVTRFHTYSPRFSMSVRTLEDLSFCAIPAILDSWSIPPVVTQLNLFAGQLYLRNYEEYISVCRLLGLCFQPPDKDVHTAFDGFIDPAARSKVDEIMARDCSFTTSPVMFLKVLMTLRRNGQSFARTHMGAILHGELIAREKFQE